ncbi:signal peptidase I [Bradyrhizobium sp. SYSU BS000235]|uniref:signal peptidase I n=1 Tax=Bradyrhizobium sp. SYSU BS000235 TaxID=3411332 RepID=UPI003C72CF09
MHWDIEYAFSHALEKTAPLVAIGTKGRSLGAAKIETDDTRWEELFADLADKARAILIIPSLTPGTRREIMAIAASESLRPKTIWIMPPTYWGIGAVIRKVLGRSHRKTWEAVRGELSHTMDLPPYQRSGALIYAGFKGTDCKQYKADDLAEDRLRPLIETVIATSRLEHEDRTQTMSAFTLPERSIRYRLEEWTYRRWLSALGTTSDRVILVLVVSLFPFLLLDFFAIAFGLKPIEITSPIMSPTVWVGDVILTTKASPVRGDVILLNGKDAPPGRYGIARLVGLPGDRLKIEHGTVYLNGTAIVQQPVADFFKGELAELLKFPFECLPEDNTLPEGIHFQTLTCGKDRSLGPATLKAGQTMTEVTVAADKFWVMYDLRSNGFALQINQADVAGRASFVAYSRKDTHGTIFSRIRWDRIFKAI